MMGWKCKYEFNFTDDVYDDDDDDVDGNDDEYVDNVLILRKKKTKKNVALKHKTKVCSALH